MKKTVIASLITVTALGLAACSTSTPIEQTSIPDVSVEQTEATPSPMPTDLTPIDLPSEAPELAPEGEVTKGDDFTLTVPVGRAFFVPVALTGGTVIDIPATEGDSITREIPAAGASLHGDIIDKAPMFYATKPGVTTGSIRVLGPDGLPNGYGTTFTITVVAE